MLKFVLKNYSSASTPFFSLPFSKFLLCVIFYSPFFQCFLLFGEGRGKIFSYFSICQKEYERIKILIIIIMQRGLFISSSVCYPLEMELKMSKVKYRFKISFLYDEILFNYSNVLFVQVFATFNNCQFIIFDTRSAAGIKNCHIVGQ